MKEYEFLDHTSEIKFVTRGKSFEEALEHSVIAFSEYICRGQKVAKKKKLAFEVVGGDNKSLFFNFLNELIFNFDANKFLPSTAKVVFDGKKLKAELFGDNAKKYRALADVKAVTYSEMKVGKKGKVWELVAVLDV